MATLKETTKKILDGLQANRGNMTESEQKSECKCVICKKIIDRYCTDSHLLLGKGVCYNPECKEKARLQHIAKHIDMFVGESGMPLKYHNLKSDRNIQSYIGSPRGVYLHGKAGRGKTVMACSIMREIILGGICPDYSSSRNRNPIQFYSNPKLIMQLQDSFKGDGDSAFKKLEKIARQNIIVLDDLGAEKLTDFVRQSLYFLINEREQWMKKTIITSNYSLDELDRYIDGRISSRIAGMCDIVEVGGEDRRIKK